MADVPNAHTYLDVTSQEGSARGSQANVFLFSSLSHWTVQINSVHSPEEEDERISHAAQCQEEDIRWTISRFCVPSLPFHNNNRRGPEVPITPPRSSATTVSDAEDVAKLINTSHAFLCLEESGDGALVFVSKSKLQRHHERVSEVQPGLGKGTSGAEGRMIPVRSILNSGSFGTSLRRTMWEASAQTGITEQMTCGSAQHAAALGTL
ncbi:hypothetical protein EYF80_036410 [Liparis tanakae]|uniref:Uncharacterized protein n=1 Tax=Liparis tanakae TaxID=230148 RepID=A0A4Z2GKF5_9TELE|nr:hypothetical protein EYF80_036410 [Liparis tanakae]